MATGSELHRQHGRRVIAAGFLQVAGYVLLAAAVLLLVVVGMLAVLK